jgi:hypothetical protein
MGARRIPRTEEAVIATRRVRRAVPCPCGCGKPDGICDPHRERLHHAMNAGGSPGQNGGHGYHHTVKARGYRPPRCCNPECGAPRPRQENFCRECRDGGWGDGE